MISVTMLQALNGKGSNMNDGIKNKGSINWKKSYHDLLNSLNIGFLSVDIDYNNKDFNERLFKMTGFRRDQLEGRNIREIYTQAEFQRVVVLLFLHNMF